MQHTQNYHETVINDLIKKTIINEDLVFLPFPDSFPQTLHHFCSLPHYYPSELVVFSNPGEETYNIARHLKEMYGTQENEVESIWGDYRLKMITILSPYYKVDEVGVGQWVGIKLEEIEGNVLPYIVPGFTREDIYMYEDNI